VERAIAVKHARKHATTWGGEKKLGLQEGVLWSGPELFRRLGLVSDERGEGGGELATRAKACQ